MRPRTTTTTLIMSASLALFGAWATADDAPPAGDPTLYSPAAQETVNRAMAAMGGAALFDSVESVSYDCAMEDEQGVMLMKVKAKNGAGVALEQSLTPPGASDPIRRQSLTTNTSAGWARDLDEGGLQIMPSGVAASIARAGDQWSLLRSATAQFRQVDHAGPAVFAGRASSKLIFTNPRSPGLQQLVMYLDDETGLPLGQETATSSGTLVSGVARVDEWQTVNGMMIPKRIAVEGQTGQSTLTFSNVAFNGVPASTFETPSDVQSMLVAGAN